MSIINPQISNKPIHINDFSSYAENYLSEEAPIYEIECYEERIERGNFYSIETKKSIFKNCIFHNCSFENASFIDVIFECCDLSNSKFTGSYFERCQFVSCKCIGIDMSGSIVKQVSFESSNFQYSNFNKIKMTDVLFNNINFSESSMSEAKLNRFEAAKSKFIKNNLFKTMLAAVDFTDNEFVAPTVSNPPIELKGAVINTFQAVDLIGLWGVVVKQL
ncbi:MAG: hypothetical protein CVU91_04755 [Firmicutes bacterium HGW-Firmicutes-16]|nr:MAG: hypothetical protein CVU91_04755 [Firmicutes bacterium HGW-Firmicutes-16]